MKQCTTESLWTSPAQPLPANLAQLTNDCMVWLRQNQLSVANSTKFLAEYTPYVLPPNKYMKLYNVTGRSTDSSPTILITISPAGQGETKFIGSANDVSLLQGFVLAVIVGPSSYVSLITNSIVVGQNNGFGSQITWPLIVPAGFQINAFMLTAAAGKPCLIDLIGILVDDTHDPNLRSDV